MKTDINFDQHDNTDLPYTKKQMDHYGEIHDDVLALEDLMWEEMNIEQKSAWILSFEEDDFRLPDEDKYDSDADNDAQEGMDKDK